MRTLTMDQLTEILSSTISQRNEWALKGWITTGELSEIIRVIGFIKESARTSSTLQDQKEIA